MERFVILLALAGLSYLLLYTEGLVKTGTFARLPWIDDIELLLPKAKGGLVHVEHLRHLADGKIELEIFILF